MICFVYILELFHDRLCGEPISAWRCKRGHLYFCWCFSYNYKWNELYEYWTQYRRKHTPRAAFTTCSQFRSSFWREQPTCSGIRLTASFLRTVCPWSGLYRSWRSPWFTWTNLPKDLLRSDSLHTGPDHSQRLPRTLSQGWDFYFILSFKTFSFQFLQA